MPASSSSSGVRGGARTPGSGPAPAASGAGRARRSTLPLGVSGRAASATKAAGTMYSGRRSRRAARRSAAVGAPPRPGHHVGDQPARRRRRPRGPATAASRTAGWAASAASISPSSMRKPRSFTWWSSAAEELDHAVRPAARQVARAVEPRRPAPANGSGTNRSAVSSGPPEVAARQPDAADAAARPARRPAPAGRPRSSRWMRGVGDRPADRHRAPPASARQAPGR